MKVDEVQYTFLSASNYNNQSFFQPIINQYWKVLDSKFFNQIKN